MADERLLLGFSGWEDRFRLGFAEEIEVSDVERVVLLGFRSYEEWTQSCRKQIKDRCKQRGIIYNELTLAGVDEPASNWFVIMDGLVRWVANVRYVTVDISCMPREIAWYVFWFLERCNVGVTYVYRSPQRYGEGWLSRYPRTPRLVYKLSGIARPAIRTALVATVGFDLQRIKRIINWCEPSRVLIGVQVTSHFSRNDQEMKESRRVLKKEYEGEFFELDAFSADRGAAEIEKALATIGSSYNIVMASLGPKLTAVTLYRIQRAREGTGLVYAPSGQYSRQYSIGIGKRFEGIL